MSLPYASYIDDEEIYLSGQISVDWDIYNVGAFTARIVRPEELGGFDSISIKRDEVEIFHGRVEVYHPILSSQGKVMEVSGFDDTIRLRDFKTPVSSSETGTTETVLTEITADTGFDIVTEGSFEYISELTDWNTWMDWATETNNLNSLALELDFTTEPVIDTTIFEETFTGTSIGLKNSFSSRGGGAGLKFYVFAKDSSNNLWYYISDDGVTWNGTDTGYNPSGDAWTVAEKNGTVLLFYYDGANTDFERGSIDPVTGLINFNRSTGNIFAGQVRFGPVWDDDGHYWILAEAASGTAYESTDGGLTWNNRFGPGANELWSILPTGSDGDMLGVALDTGNNHLEEWLWDRSASTFTFQNVIGSENDVDSMDACVDYAYNVYVFWRDGLTVYIASNQSGSWDKATVRQALPYGYGCGSDRRNAYLFISNAAGTYGYKYYGIEEQERWTAPTSLQIYFTDYINCPRCGLNTNGDYRIFLNAVDYNDDIRFFVFKQTGVRLAEGESTGYIYISNLTTSPDFTNWGLLSTNGTDIDNGGILYDIEWGGFPLIDDISPNVDLLDEGLTSDYTTIDIYIEWDNSGGLDPIVFSSAISERRDYVEFDTDGEDCFTAVSNLARGAGADFWITYDEDMDTYTLHFSTERGEDKSDYIILKFATSTDEADVKPNIKLLDKTYDWSNYANCILFLGGTNSDGDRVEVEVKDEAEVYSRGQEYWYTMRDASVTSDTIGRQLASLELTARKQVVTRVALEFVDKNLSNDIQIGDTVQVIAEWDDEELAINEALRIVKLVRTWGTGIGENVYAELSNQTKQAEYYKYLKKVDELERWSVS